MAIQLQIRNRAHETESTAPSRASFRGDILLIFAVLLLSYAYFYQGGGWNQNSRFDLIRAILDEHTFRIDSYQSNTQDKALFQTHFYSDKAPGQALTALPFVAIARPAMRFLRIDPPSPGSLVAQSYVATLFSSSIPMALAACCLYWIAVRLGSPPNAAAFAAISLGLATPNWTFATLLFGHALAGACLLLAFAAALVLQDTRPGVGELKWGVAVGLAAGWATVTEYPAAPASAILVVFALALVWSRRWPSRWRAAVGVGTGAIACAAVLMAYQYVAFASPFQPGYAHYESGAFPWMQHGFLGITYPKPLVLLKLLFGGHLGLFVLSPVLIAAPFGIRRLWRQERARTIAMAAAAVPLYYWLFNGSFSGWHGGNTYGPRYMLPGIPIVCIGLAPVYAAAGRNLRRILLFGMSWGIALSLMAEATTVQPPQMMRFPVVQLIWPSFWSGHLSLNQYSMLAAGDDPTGRLHGAFNLGQLIGLPGLSSLIPLIIVWGLAGWAWKRTYHRSIS